MIAPTPALAGGVALALAIALLGGGCAGIGSGYCAAPLRPVTVAGAGPAAVYRTLQTPAGPARFAQVSPRLYRGGQPTAAQLRLLHELGVRTIVTLVDDPAIVATETADAAALGIRVYNFPFSGWHEPEPALLHRIVGTLAEADGPVYVHCHLGRDRTSLAVALYRVWVDDWSPDEAWRKEAQDFGHRGLTTLFLRKLTHAFRHNTALTYKAITRVESPVAALP
jgi:protein tyrosine phosphatase (PTP) superfamily phosphohydrolase (DUF442 family)